MILVSGALILMAVTALVAHVVVSDRRANARLAAAHQYAGLSNPPRPVTVTVVDVQPLPPRL